jgi:hypothetical protein
MDNKMFRKTILRFGVLLLMFSLVYAGTWLVPHATVHAQSINWPPPPYTPVNVSFSSASTQTLVAAPTAGGICVYELSLINAGGTAVTVNVYLDGGTTSVSSVYLAASGGAAFWPLGTNPKNPWFLTNATTGFAVKTSGASQIQGSVYAAICP